MASGASGATSHQADYVNSTREQAVHADYEQERPRRATIARMMRFLLREARWFLWTFVLPCVGTLALDLIFHHTSMRWWQRLIRFEDICSTALAIG